MGPLAYRSSAAPDGVLLVGDAAGSTILHGEGIFSALRAEAAAARQPLLADGDVGARARAYRRARRDVRHEAATRAIGS
jgi:flavin-dependent dehydrogenase